MITLLIVLGALMVTIGAGYMVLAAFSWWWLLFVGAYEFSPGALVWNLLWTAGAIGACFGWWVMVGSSINVSFG